ncbi:hypothetical protein RB2150_13456 [Rhodobacteraceae bacterium HTCC2150]|nr:hypothetical protein RB2150_13456 [Rhodobacteraceae bacterium HTCC2150]
MDEMNVGTSVSRADVDLGFNTLKSVSLHLGAHKTATTHLQRSLARAHRRLRQRGIGLHVAEKLRNEGVIMGPDVEKSASPETIQTWRNHFIKATDGFERVVISDENLLGAHHRPGLPPHLKMYKTAAKRLAKLEQVFADTEMTVFLGIRNPTDYLESSFSQSLVHGRWASVEEFLESAPVASIQWAPLVKSLAERLPVVLWRYEDYSQLFPQIISNLVDPELADRIKPEGQKHQIGLSVKAVEMILDNKVLHAVRTRAEFALSVRDMFPPENETDKFRFYDRLSRMEGMTAYEKDVEEIKSIPNVTFLRP